MSGTPQRRPPSRDPYGLLASGTPIAAVVSIIGLIVVGIVTFSLLNGEVPLAGGANPGTSDRPISQTPAPSNVVIVPTDAPVNIPGTFVYAKQGNVWLQHGLEVKQLTSGGQDSMPSFSPDGRYVYFIRTNDERGQWPAQGVVKRYRMKVPSIYRVPVDGSAKPESLFDGTVKSGDLRWFSWLREPVLGPDGHTIALVSDAPLPNRSDVVLQLLDQRNGRLTPLRVPETAPLGHQDPAWRPDGRVLLYVKNGREQGGGVGTPEIWSYSIGAGKGRRVSGPGYLDPSYSPDGRWIAATRTTQFGTDVVILDALKGTEVARLTNDGSSWAPVWSPAGDAIAFLHIAGEIVDLRMIPLTGTGPSWTPGEAKNLTEVSGLDAASRPGWFIPPDQLPKTSAAPASAAASTSPASLAPASGAGDSSDTGSGATGPGATASSSP